MRFFFPVICFSLVSFMATAQQFAYEYWHDGKIILESGDTLRGKVKYDMQADIVQLKDQNSLEAYSARKILFFEIFDVTISRYRQFYSLPYATSGEYRAPIFFELLEEGKITLLSRESIEYRTYSSSFSYYGTYNRLVLVNKFFLLKESGEIEPFIGKKNDWLGLMGNYAEEVQKFVKSRRLDFDEKYELSQIIAYYNSFFK